MTKVSDISRCVRKRATEYGAKRVYLFGSYAHALRNRRSCYER